MIKCGCCSYKNPSDKWTRIEASSGDGYSKLTCVKYDIESNKLNHLGSVDLYACPICNMITWQR